MTSVACVASHLSEHLLEELSILFHVLFDVRQQVFRPGLPVFCLISDAAGEEDEFVGVRRRQNEILGVAAHHAQAVDQHADEEVGFTQILTGCTWNQVRVDQGGQRS